jgi:hypothetical protein
VSADYRRNHYVPVWYQKRFIPPSHEKRELFYLDLRPTNGYRDGSGRFHLESGPRRLGPRWCFYEQDLYTTHLQTQPSTEIERILFGRIDSDGKQAVEAFGSFSYQREALLSFHPLLDYLSAQKFRTPKGLRWLESQVETHHRDGLLSLMVQLRNIYQAIWAECVWMIADASECDTKFIVSDHPVTVYNRSCGPRSEWCRDSNDPDIRCHATHTLFPLSADKILILTNLSWVRNPYQAERSLRPNPTLARTGIFKFMDVQSERHLNEQEVREINFIVKSRAFRYIAAAEEDWLYPEKYVSKSDWASFGDGYLLMPEPRLIHGGGSMVMGYDDGRVRASDEYGRRPWEAGYQTGSGTDEAAALDRFKGEFARLYGPTRRARLLEAGQLSSASETEEFHRYHLSLELLGKQAMRRERSRQTAPRASTPRAGDRGQRRRTRP